MVCHSNRKTLYCDVVAAGVRPALWLDAVDICRWANMAEQPGLLQKVEAESGYPCRHQNEFAVCPPSTVTT